MSTGLKEVAHRFLTIRLRTLGFNPSGSLRYCRRVNSCRQLITVSGRFDNGKLRFTCTLGVRIDEIESLLRPESEAETYPTVSCPIHLLRPEREYYEWEGGTEAEIQIAVDSLVAEIEDVGSEFFSKFSTIAAIESELSHSSVSDYFVLSAHERIGTLAAISLARGNRSDAKELIDGALNDPRNTHPAKQRRLKELRARLLAN